MSAGTNNRPAARIASAVTALAAGLALALAPAAVAAHPGGPAPGQAKKLAAAAPAPPGHARPQRAGRTSTSRGQAKRRARVAAAAPAPRARAAATRPARRRAHRHGRRTSAPRRRGVSTTVGAAALARAATPVPAAAPRAHAKRARRSVQPPKPARGLSVVTRTVARTVRDIVHSIPAWAKALIAALLALFAVAALVAALGARRNRGLRRQRAALLGQVGVLQAALLPEVPEHVGALAVSVAYRPAAGLAAGGDFYDVFELDRGRVGIVVGDVSGHGREALGPAASTGHMVSSYLAAGLAPRAALKLAGKVMDEHRRDDFATVVAAVHDPAAGTLSYATAGHPPPVIVGSGVHVPLTVASSPPLGVDSPTGQRQTTLPLAPGSTVCFFTDGLIEARRGAGIFGLPRLQRVVAELEPGAGADALIERVARESDLLPDDIAVCLIRAEGGAAAGSVRVEEIEVTPAELQDERIRRFLGACGLDEHDVEAVIAAAAPEVARHGSVVLRARLAAGRSGVDVIGAEPGPVAAGLAALASPPS